MTTPPCTESVEWIVVPEPVPVRLVDYWKFHEILDEENTPLSQNYRPDQALNDREVYVFQKQIGVGWSASSYENWGVVLLHALDS